MFFQTHFLYEKKFVFSKELYKTYRWFRKTKRRWLLSEAPTGFSHFRHLHLPASFSRTVCINVLWRSCLTRAHTYIELFALRQCMPVLQFVRSSRMAKVVTLKLQNVFYVFLLEERATTNGLTAIGFFSFESATYF